MLDQSGTMSIGKWIDALEAQRQEWLKHKPSWWYLAVVSPFVIMAAGLIYQWHLDKLIAAREKTVFGVLTSRDPANHNCFRFSFSVGTNVYGGCGTPHDSEPRTGEQVLVYYDPLDPGVNSLVSFSEVSVSDLSFLPIPATFTGLGVVYIFWWRRRAATHQARDAKLC